ncbi:MAG: preprotein translocase subunit SecG [Deltaproteobacteria bacterium]|nr:preprotein translocase subunit SecG [Deltaproteobacteria bacterium]
MFTVTVIIHLFASVVMILSVLLQVGKGATLGSSFGGGGSSTLFGSSGPAPLLAKITGVCAALFMLTSLYLTYHSSRYKSESVMSALPVVEKKAESPTAQPTQPGTTGTEVPQPKK